LCLGLVGAGPGRAEPPVADPGQTPNSAPTAAVVTPNATVQVPDAAATATSDKARRAACERYVAALSGSEKERAALKDPEVQALAVRVPDLVTCAAVKADSEALCAPLVGSEPAEKQKFSAQAIDCRYTQSIFHEARTYPKSTAFMFPEFDQKQCDD